MAELVPAKTKQQTTEIKNGEKRIVVQKVKSKENGAERVAELSTTK